MNEIIWHVPAHTPYPYSYYTHKHICICIAGWIYACTMLPLFLSHSCHPLFLFLHFAFGLGFGFVFLFFSIFSFSVGVISVCTEFDIFIQKRPNRIAFVFVLKSIEWMGKSGRIVARQICLFVCKYPIIW